MTLFQAIRFEYRMSRIDGRGVIRSVIEALRYGCRPVPF